MKEKTCLLWQLRNLSLSQKLTSAAILLCFAVKNTRYHTLLSCVVYTNYLGQFDTAVSSCQCKINKTKPRRWRTYFWLFHIELVKTDRCKKRLKAQGKAAAPEDAKAVATGFGLHAVTDWPYQQGLSNMLTGITNGIRVSYENRCCVDQGAGLVRVCRRPGERYADVCIQARNSEKAFSSIMFGEDIGLN